MDVIRQMRHLRADHPQFLADQVWGGGQSPFKVLQPERHRRQSLVYIVMKVARDSPPFLFLSREELGRQRPERLLILLDLRMAFLQRLFRPLALSNVAHEGAERNRFA